jgi:hypothetical protein
MGESLGKKSTKAMREKQAKRNASRPGTGVRRGVTVVGN